MERRLLILLLTYLPLVVMAQDDGVEHLLAQMTLEEKMGQLTLLQIVDTPDGANIDLLGQKHLAMTDVGAVLSASGAEKTRQLQRLVVEGSRLHIPLLFSQDVIHGFCTMFPVPLAEASAWEPELTQRTAHATAVEATANGVHWTFAPMIDITRDPRWGRVVEGSGEDPFLGSAMATARIKGFHGDGPTSTAFMLTTAKHFVAYGAAEAGRDYNTVDLSQRTLWEVYLLPFQAAVQASVDAIMPAFNELDGLPMASNQALLDGVLRRRWGFSGMIVSDHDALSELITHGIAATPLDASRQAIDAGLEIEMANQFFRQNLPYLVSNGQVPMATVDNAVRRVLKAKQRLGLFDDPYRYSDTTRQRLLSQTPEARALAREAAQKSIVLLKNADSLLPLSKELHNILVVGSLATDTATSLAPCMTAGQPIGTTSILQGIQNATSTTSQVVYVPGASPSSQDTQGIAAAQNAAQDADVIVAVLGETSNMSGEANSRASLDLPGAQNALLRALLKTGKPVVVILMNGRPLVLTGTVKRAPAIIESWFLGTEAGNAVADVLFGDINPSGKLPMTFPRSVGQVPIYYAHKNTGRPIVGKDDTWRSRYIDQPSTPLYPFGFGLSYTTFSYGTPQLSSSRLSSSQTLTVRTNVTNTGPRAGDEIVQLYLRDNVASVTRPVRQLRGFRKVHLRPGQTQQVVFTLDENDFAVLDAGFEPRVEAGTFTLFVGGDSTTDNRAHFEVTDSRKLSISSQSVSPNMSN
ncbi:beta-glucosidase BglX [Pseudomonas sp. MAFF 301514]|uniref:beta-glucosidase n=1 Tax=Pseudomonas allii TaxID=2740531 RepID=A0A7Y8UWR9_9PSED|nr:beta-glucosidase BglX [Pseudomonas allii]NWN49294.1 beta-glucosidase BglX [Pseudomonas allii]NWN61373.1 beta-glucosidase BglX [Pseudomonas allii]